MVNFYEWYYLIAEVERIVDVEFYYMLIKQHSGITVKIREEHHGWEQDIGTYPNLEEVMNALEEYKEKVEKLAKFEEDLNLF